MAGRQAKRKAAAAAPATAKKSKQARTVVVVESASTELATDLETLVPLGGRVGAAGSQPLNLQSYTQRLLKAMSAPGAVRRYADHKRRRQAPGASQ